MEHKTTRIPTLRRRPSNEAASLVLIYGAERIGKQYPLQAELTIGRDADNDIVLDLNDVSRRHVRIAQRHGIWTVTDLNSTNGTMVNDQLITAEVPLVNGDLIKIGGAILKYLAGGNVEAQFHEEIYRMTIFDGLTGAYNRRHLHEFLDREVARSARYGAPLILAILDLDHFKSINDEHGHPAGDHVLQKVAAAARALVRREQLFARYGGEEFALVMPELDLEQARGCCERLRETIATEPIMHGTARIPVTVSAGVAQLEKSMSGDGLIAAADAELYRAKRAGRNRVVVVGDDVESV